MTVGSDSVSAGFTCSPQVLQFSPTAKPMHIRLSGDASGTWVHIECLCVDWMDGPVTHPGCIPDSDQ